MDPFVEQTKSIYRQGVTQKFWEDDVFKELGKF